jgi:hypothetical protein
MNFPMDHPFFAFLYWLINTPGLGGIFVSFLAGTLLLSIARTLKWIHDGGKTDEKEVFTYPTSGFHEHSQEPREFEISKY